MGETRGRRSETEPLEYHGEPLRRLDPIDLTGPPKALVFVQPGWGERLAELAPRDPESKPFLRTGPLTVTGEFTGTFDADALDRFVEAVRNHPEYCNVCENFPCLGGHPPAE
jgi:hypothetical protein